MAEVSELSEGQKQLIALGIFVLEFAQTEQFLLDTLATLGQISDSFAKAAFSGVKGETAISYLRRYFQMIPIGQEQKSIFEEVFSHFTPINSARNLILHHGIESGGLIGFISTNRSKALSADKAHTIRVSSEILDQMTDDLQKMTMMLMTNMFRHQKVEITQDKNMREVLQRPWRYTPPPQPDSQKRAAQKDQPQRKKQQRPPKPSPE